MRKTIDFTIDSEGRDKGKVFVLTEMGAASAEKWALRALSAAARAGVDVTDVPNGGMAGLAVVGIEALLKVNFIDAEPLLDELFDCVKIRPDPKNPSIVRVLVEDDTEEIETRLKLRMEVLKLHVKFLPGAGASSQTSETAPISQGSPITKTSPPLSGRPSRITRPR
jgi:hypothetical protein